MTTDRGFIDPLSLALYAFVIFVVVLAIGIGVDQWTHEAPTEPTQEQTP